MIFDDVKIGDRFRELNAHYIEITVTELTEKGFKYSCKPFSIKTSNSPPTFGMVSGGELFIKNHPEELWDLLYEKVNI